ncbi:hypothetical protein HPB51_016647 [Rhipicephalus microplus]|uniref:MOSC domain-containing protein n=1 Tax=Rhipicephalus microplus TaxID=6941 RepID=A0A9J6EHB6_RHIMP|nr:hypothetical protein HPB51_016647 [Rhipicephalus microplus]
MSLLVLFMLLLGCRTPMAVDDTAAQADALTMWLGTPANTRRPTQHACFLGSVDHVTAGSPTGPTVAFQDRSSFQVLSKPSLDELVSRLPPGSDIRQRNFRPSLFVDGCEAHSEDHWARYRIGDAEMAFLERTRR